MAFQEVSQIGWFGRIGSSIKGILFGVVLILVALVVLVLNERNAVADIRANKELAAKVVSVGNDTVDAANEGKLVHMNGPAKTEDILKNSKFGIEENAIRLSWDAQIYQWEENEKTETKKKLGGGEERVTTYTYKKEWASSPVDSSGFKESGHENAGEQEYQSGSEQAKEVTLGAFSLAPRLISQIRSSEPYVVAKLPSSLEGKGTIADGVFYTGDLNNPNVGDERVAFTLTRPGDVSVIAVQMGNTFSAYKTKSGKDKFVLYEGLLTANEVVQGEEGKAKVLRWILRGLGTFMMFIGFGLLMKPLSVLADVVPLFGSLVGGVTWLISLLLSVGISFVVIAISWISFRPLIGIPLLVLGVGCFVLVIRKLMKARKEMSPAHA
jgi:hypothetical protein